MDNYLPIGFGQTRFELKASGALRTAFNCPGALWGLERNLGVHEAIDNGKNNNFGSSN
jgi:hypothetical protein